MAGSEDAASSEAGLPLAFVNRLLTRPGTVGEAQSCVRPEGRPQKGPLEPGTPDMIMRRTLQGCPSEKQPGDYNSAAPDPAPPPEAHPLKQEHTQVNTRQHRLGGPQPEAPEHAPVRSQLRLWEQPVLKRKQRGRVWKRPPSRMMTVTYFSVRKSNCSVMDSTI